jgi:hypothetical protein
MEWRKRAMDFSHRRFDEKRITLETTAPVALPLTVTSAAREHFAERVNEWNVILSATLKN